MMFKQPEIVIIGAGISGFAAAIAAAKENKKVLLVERSDAIGGNATNSNVGTICGAYYRTFSESPRLTGYKFSKDFIQQLISLSDNKKPLQYHKGLFIYSYEWSILQKFLEKELIDNGVEILKGSEIIDVNTEQKCITQLSIKTTKEIIEIHPRSVIDCSGNGIISQLGKLEMISSSGYQSASQIFRVQNIMSENEFSLNMALKKAMASLVDAHNWPQSFASLSVVPGSLKNNQADLKITLPETITDDKEANKKLSTKAKAYVREIFPPLANMVESLKNASVITIFSELGIRVQQRSKGKYILTEADVLSCKKFKNGIALGTWPIEEWGSDGKLSMEYFEPECAYMIPADCLLSDALDNLYFAGKNISATTKAIASARVMGTCLQTGYAAGKIASCQSSEACEKMIVSLNKELLLE
ncbi:MAG: FAD-dependent oxidoreductase [Bacteroidota bacterium]